MIFNPDHIVEQINAQLSKAQFGNSPTELYEPIRYFMQLGGKRLRPLLTVYGAYLFSDNYEKAIEPSLGIEIFHNFTLMHDDIMDKAPLRRNQQTVHEKWDQNVAILAGDVMLVKAYEYLIKAESALLPEILNPFNVCAAQVCEGQQLDVNFETSDSIDEQNYLEMIRLKTAVLLGLALEVGATIGGANKNDRKWIKEAGINMGMAFQLQDDLLDVFGDQKKFGKKVGGDIVANKKTFLLIKALEKSDSKQAKLLKKCLSDTTIQEEDKIANVTKIYQELDIRELTEQKIEFFIKEALQCLSNTSSPLYKRNALKKYFFKLAQREN